MFLDSTKVVIYESTVSGKETGPKRGSEGYIIANSISNEFANKCLLDNIKTQSKIPTKSYVSLIDTNFTAHLFEAQNYLYSFAKSIVYFTRFGFEKSIRIEKKEVINVFPVYLNKEIKKEPFINKKCIENIRYITNTNWPIVVAIPDFFSSPAPFLKDTIALEAWGTSVLKNNMLKLILASTSNEVMTGVFLNNYLLKYLFLTKIAKKGPVTLQCIKDIIPNFKYLKELYKNRGDGVLRGDGALINDLRLVNSLMLKIYNSHLRNKSAYQNDYYFVTNPWKRVCLNRTATETTLGKKAELRDKVGEMQQFLIKSWAAQTKSTNLSFQI